MFRKVWVSSVDHLKGFSSILLPESTNPELNVIYTNIPSSFPQNNKKGMYCFPIIYFGKGRLSIEDEDVIFTSKYSVLVDRHLKNIKRNLDFHLKRSDIKSVTRYQHPQPRMSFIPELKPINWVRIITKSNLLNSDFLLCIPCVISFKKRERGNDRLYKTILDFSSK